ncbi:MAG: hydrogenase accessory protein HypB [Planctomycetales bacterium 4484_113]|nr:MAG: hydrogenase accessory protein HypB [Planctomycetales bacterium 4484_113]
MVKVSLEKRVLSKNDRIAQKIRSQLHMKGVGCINLIGSPGSGKTALLEASLPRMSDGLRCAVIEGDVKTDRDMQRIAAVGVDAVQIETGGGCHLDAELVTKGLAKLPLGKLDLLIIENVGNLICPVAYDLGEDYRLIVVSVAEGEDKPLKYPSAFVSASGIVVTKTDLSSYVDVEASQVAANALSLNPKLKVFTTSTKTGEGIEEFADFLVSVGKSARSMRK